MSKRLFIGSLLSPEDSAHLYGMKDEFDIKFSSWWNCSLRWVKPEKLHITWLFLNQCNEEQEQAVQDGLCQLLSKFSKMELEYDKMEFIGSANRPNALVLLANPEHPQAKDLASTLRKELGKFCQKEEDLGFLPHITMFRMPRDHNGKYPMREEIDLSAYLPYKQAISKVSLIESHFGTGRSDYKTLAEFQL